MKNALATFRLEGGEYSLAFPAEDWADAERRLQAIRTTATLTGFPAYRIPANPLTFPFATAFVCAFAWLRNILR